MIGAETAAIEYVDHVVHDSVYNYRVCVVTRVWVLSSLGCRVMFSLGSIQAQYKHRLVQGQTEAIRIRY